MSTSVGNVPIVRSFLLGWLKSPNTTLPVFCLKGRGKRGKTDGGGLIILSADTHLISLYLESVLYSQFCLVCPSPETLRFPP